ncbi:MAG: HDOD domain-containing protein, partial [Chitinispirillaceae bacterium]
MNTKENPLILIFSKRERIRDILTVGFLQCNYQVIQADTAVIAMLKANQFLPAVIIADILPQNIHDLLIINRLHQSERTSKIKFVAIVPPRLKDPLEQHIAHSEIEGMENILHFLEYPFNFSNILRHIQTILKIKPAAGDSRQEKVDQIRHNFQLAQKLQDPSVSTETKLSSIAAGIQKQWAFPFTVIKALDIIGSRDSCCAELARCIGSDPSASTSILKVANTVFYARRQSRISDLREAVVRLGFHQTRNLLSCLALIDLTRDIHGKSGFTRSEFWLHSLSVALIAEQICNQCKFKRPELAFVAGLIHDIGKIPMDNLFEDLFIKLLDETVSRIIPFNRAESHSLGFNHAELGHYLTRQWNFPQSISNTILYHHRPEVILKSFPVTERILQGAVFTANLISKSIQIGHSCDSILREIPASILRELKMTDGPSQRFLTTVIRRINLLAKYLNIAIRSLNPTPPAANGSVGDIL